MEQTPPPACPTCKTPYDARNNIPHCKSPTCDWIVCGTIDCATTYHPLHPEHNVPGE